jgi:hypothetical protein
VDQQITAPTEDDILDLARRVALVSQLAKQHLGRPLERDDSDLDALQGLLDAGVPAASETFQLQCLGIVFGMRVIAAVEGLDWAMVEDEYGRDPALRYQTTSLLVFPMTMISKRIEAGDEVDVRELFEGVCTQIEALKDEVGRPD